MSDRAVFHNPLLRDGFAQTPNPIIRCPKLSNGAVRMYAVLLSYAWLDPDDMPTQEQMGQECFGKDRRTVWSYLQELKKERLLDVVRRGLTKPNEYHFLDFYKTRPDLFLLQADPIDGKKSSHQGGKEISPPEGKDPSPPAGKEISPPIEEQYPDTVQQQLLSELRRYGMPEAKASLTLSQYGAGPVATVLLSLSQRKTKVERPAGWILTALKEGWDVRSAGEKKKESEARKMQADKGKQDEAKKEREAAETKRKKVDAWIAANPEAAVRMFDAEKEKAQKAGKYYGDTMVRASVRMEIAKSHLA